MDTVDLSTLAHSDTANIHASCVAVDRQAILILGRSGSGKSGLALQMMALGAGLVADDRVELTVARGQVMAVSPMRLRGLIEARGVGLLHASAVGITPVAYVLDLDQTEDARLPAEDSIELLRQRLPLLKGSGVPNLAASMIQLVKMGRVSSEWSSA